MGLLAGFRCEENLLSKHIFEIELQAIMVVKQMENMCNLCPECLDPFFTSPVPLNQSEMTRFLEDCPSDDKV
jgi:hypothetical protein